MLRNGIPQVSLSEDSPSECHFGPYVYWMRSGMS